MSDTELLNKVEEVFELTRNDLHIFWAQNGNPLRETLREWITIHQPKGAPEKLQQPKPHNE